jgi:dihydroxyacetone kinase-like protein
MERILKDMDPKAGDEVAVMINGAGATPPMELYILNRRVQQILADKGVKVFKTFVGDYMTSIDMAGASITLLKLDAELKDLLLAQADTIGFKMY